MSTCSPSIWPSVLGFPFCAAVRIERTVDVDVEVYDSYKSCQALKASFTLAIKLTATVEVKVTTDVEPVTMRVSVDTAVVTVRVAAWMKMTVVDVKMKVVENSSEQKLSAGL